MRSTFRVVIAALLVSQLSGCASDTACDANCNVGDTREPHGTRVDEGGEPNSDNAAEASNGQPEGDSGSGPSSAFPRTDAAAETADAGTGNQVTTDGTDAANDASALKVDAATLDPTDARNAPVEHDAGQAQTTSDGGTTISSAPGASRGIECAQICAAAQSKGCGDNWSCETDMCSLLDIEPACASEAKVYMSCVAAGDPEAEFECMDRQPFVTSERCLDPYGNTWMDCVDRVQNPR